MTMGFVSCIFMPLLFVKWCKGYFHSFYDTHLASDNFRDCWSDQLLWGSHRWRGTTKSFPPSVCARALESQAGCCYQRCGRETEVADALWFKHHLLSLSFHGNSGKSMIGFWHSFLSLLLLLYLSHIFHPFLFSLPFPWRGAFQFWLALTLKVRVAKFSYFAEKPWNNFMLYSTSVKV